MVKQKGGKGMNVALDVSLGALAGLVVFLFGDWTMTLNVLATILVIELVTGIAKGLMSHSMDSKIFSKGLIKKGAIFLVIILAHLADVVAGTGNALMTVATLYYIGVEGVSIIENLGHMGVPIPNVIKKRFEQLKEENEEEQEDDY